MANQEIVPYGELSRDARAARRRASGARRSKERLSSPPSRRPKSESWLSGDPLGIQTSVEHDFNPTHFGPPGQPPGVMYGVLRGAQTVADWTVPRNLRDVAIKASLGPILGVAGRPIARAVQGLGRGAWSASAPFRRGSRRYLNDMWRRRRRLLHQMLTGRKD